MTEANIIDFPHPRWVNELISAYRESGHDSEADMIFDLYDNMRKDPGAFSADKIYQVLIDTYAKPGDIQIRRKLGNAAIFILPD